jgi:hypothetical protein
MRKVLAYSILAIGLGGIPAIAAPNSDSVRQAQQALKDKGFDPGAVDGVDGPKTRAAVRAYQKKNDLTADGRLGEQTLTSLGVQQGTAGTEFKKSGTNIKHSYTAGGKEVADGSKDLGSDVKHGHPVEAAKDFGKGVGHGAEKVGVGTGHAATNAAKGVKDAVTGKE